ncbi:MAG: hypothetical protein PVH11_02545 [Anaerolineae bacterium]|jgi:hypothetical protein
MSTVHAAPSYRMHVTQSPPADYPRELASDAYVSAAVGTFAERRQEYLAHCLRNPAPNNTKAAYHELVRLAAGGTPHEGVFHAAFDFIEGRNDCADFTLHSILRLLYQFADHPRVDAKVLERAQKTVLGFKYWPDEPGIDSLCTWTENHHILFASGAYLAGQLYPDAVFVNSGHTGREKMALNRPRILRWLDLRFRTGFSEWLSHVYYDEDLTALLSLVDFCLDSEIRQRAAMVTDLLLLDIALNSYRGLFGSSHGRAYENTKKWASNEGTIDTQKLLFGMGQYSGFDNMSAASFALSRTYRMPPVLAAIAGDLDRPEMESRQRMGIRVAEAERWGLAFDDFEDGMVFLSLEAYVHPRTAGLTLRMFDAFNWWQNSFFAPFQPYRGLLSILRRTRTLGLLVRALEWDLCRNTREEVNVYTYRTPDYMLSCAQDYRAGYGGDQQHIWQATLGPDAVCFATHPAKLAGATPNYWAGAGQLPRAVQVKNVLIAVHNVHNRPALYVPTRLDFTHAWLPRDRFDEVLEREGWIFARKGQGYLALRSQQPYYWQNEPGPDQVREIIAEGKQNVWICEMGRQATDGTFAAFAQRICAAQLAFQGLSVVYRSPSQGRLEFGWQRPLRQEGRVVPVHGYARYENPYATTIEAGSTGFPAQSMRIHAGEHRLSLDWSTARREVGIGTET